jgi:hypothetical protein
MTFLDGGKRLTPPNIELPGGATKTGVRPVSAGFDGVPGNGRSLTAAERTGRRCYRLEIHPVHVDTIICRREALTGGRPRHAVRACSFDDLAREAEAANAR